MGSTEPFTLEPCETSKADLDEYAAVLERIAEEARKDPEFVKASPHKCASHVVAKPEELNDQQVGTNLEGLSKEA